MSAAPDLDDFDGEWVLLRDGAVADHDRDEQALRERAEPHMRPGDALVRIGHPPAGYHVTA
ncbi:MAG TPA: hypothetical protein VFS37_14740 [Conexibacter sp.]|nr:hypothetical protein [Conexibacter sp.]